MPETRPLTFRAAKAYLLLTACLYLLTGILGLFGNGWGFASFLWFSNVVIRPFPAIAILQHCAGFSHCSIYGFSYISSFEPLGPNFLFFTLTVIVVSLLAIWASVAAARGDRRAQLLWMVLAVVSVISALGNVGADLADWGGPTYRGSVTAKSILYVSLSLTYVVAVALVLVYSSHRTLAVWGDLLRVNRSRTPAVEEQSNLAQQHG